MRWRRTLVVGGVTLIALPAACLIGVNAFLNLGLSALLNGQPDRLQITWRWAWMWKPGDVSVDGLHIYVQDPLDTWTIDVDHAAATIDLAALRGHTFSAGAIRASGGVFHFETRVPPEGEVRVPVPNPWAVELHDIQLAGLREAWLGDAHYQGEANVSGEVYYQLADHLELRDVVLDLTGGEVSAGGAVVANAIQGRVELAIAPLNPAGGVGLFGFVTARIALTGQSQDLRYLDFYLSAIPWVNLTGGVGDLTVDVNVDHGRFGVDSRVTANVRGIDAHWFDYLAHGDGVLEVLVGAPDGVPATTLTVDFGAYTITRAGLEAALVQGSGFQVTARSPDVALDKPLTGLSIDLDLPDATVQDFSAYDLYLPAGLGLSLQGGTGKLHGHLHASTPDNTASGEMTLEGEGIRMRLDKLAVKARLALNAHLVSGSLDAGAYDVSGTSLSLRDVRLVDGADDREGRDGSVGWWADLTFQDAHLTPGAPVFLDARLKVKLRDTVPIITVLSAKKPLPSWVRGALALQRVAGTARVRLGDDLVSVPELTLRAGAYGVVLKLRATHGDTRTLFLLDYGALAVGMRVSGAVAEVHLLDARRWYAAQPSP